MNTTKKEFMENGRMSVWITQALVNETMRVIGDKIAEMAGEEQAMIAMLIFEELFVNIANYAYPNTEEKPVVIECTKLTGTPLQIILYDNGQPFDPTKYDCEEVKSEKVGGHGIRLVRELSSEFKYLRQNNHNIVKVALLA